MKRLLLFLVVFLPLQTSEIPRPSDARALIGSLPQELQGQARDLLDSQSDQKRTSIATNLARNSPAATVSFLLTVLHQDSSPAVRRAIVHHLGRYPDARVTAALKEWVLAEKDTDVALLALERLRGLSTLEVQKLLTSRMAATTGTEEIRKLELEQERLLYLVRGVILPAWMRTPPPVFSVTSKASVRVLAFGDQGDGGDGQMIVAKAIAKYNRLKRFDLGITVGDNFQDTGPESPSDPRWLPRWQKPYPALKIPFYPVLGNHDWAGPSGPAAEVLYSAVEPSWHMPSTYYSFVAGPIQFFALDTNALLAAQLRWLSKALDESRARWKIVYGHHPVFSSGSHGANDPLLTELLPVIKGRADAYLCGHDHHMEHLQPRESVHFFICGTGGHELRPPRPNPTSLFSHCDYGFLVLSADPKQLTFEFVDKTQATLYRYSLR